MKQIFFVSLLIMIISSVCMGQTENTVITNQEMLELAFMHSNYHLQSAVEQKLFKNLGISSAEFVVERIKKNEIDSVTCLTYDRNGRIISRITTECTTVGCLPYIIRQEFEYDGDRISRMNDYTFRYKYKTVKDYWNLTDTSKLSKFDWEDFTYIDDTVKIESGSTRYKYILTDDSKVFYKSMVMKTNKQKSETYYKYSDSEISAKSKNDLTVQPFKWKYEIISNNIVKMTREYEMDEETFTEFIFNTNGLLDKIVNYNSGEISSIKRVSFSYYDI